MKGSEARFWKLLTDNNAQYSIPVFQRKYSWDLDNCKQLWNDLVKLRSDDYESHFFGSLVYYNKPNGGSDEYVVIDGQQRITTVTLLVLAMHHYCVHADKQDPNHTVYEKTNMVSHLWDKYLVDEDIADSRKTRLVPIDTDIDAFDKILYTKDNKDLIEHSLLTINYLYFYNKIALLDYPVDEILEAIKKLMYIKIFLHPEDNPQLIFESLNSTGKKLSEGDKIRNFILMGLPVVEQEKLYNEYWKKLEEKVGVDVSDFTRNYLTIQLRKLPSMSVVYDKFKRYYWNHYTNTNESVEAFLSDFVKYGDYYNQITQSNTSYNKVNEVLDRLNILNSTVTYPFFMSFFDYAYSNEMEEQEIVDVLCVIETYIFRRHICQFASNALTNVFMTLHREVVKYLDGVHTYKDVLVSTLLQKVGIADFPDDEIFAERFYTRDMYNNQKKNRLYLFSRLENQYSKEVHDVVKNINERTWTIEHIMPQKLTNAWRKSLGEDYDSIHVEWLHRIGNLTLTGYNSEYSNATFADKKNAENGFNDSVIRLNHDVAQCEKWTLDELKLRNKRLTDKALKLWPMPTTTFVRPEPPVDSYTLQINPRQFTGRYVKYFVYQGERSEDQTDWVETVIQILKLISEDHLAKMIQFASEEKYRFSTRNYRDGTQREISDNLYFAKNCSTYDKIVSLQKLFEVCELEESDLEFALVPKA